jgi:hypothetical protein
MGMFFVGQVAAIAQFQLEKRQSVITIELYSHHHLLLAAAAQSVPDDGVGAARPSWPGRRKSPSGLDTGPAGCNCFFYLLRSVFKYAVNSASKASAVKPNACRNCSPAAGCR